MQAVGPTRRHSRNQRLDPLLSRLPNPTTTPTPCGKHKTAKAPATRHVPSPRSPFFYLHEATLAVPRPPGATAPRTRKPHPEVIDIEERVVSLP